MLKKLIHCLLFIASSLAMAQNPTSPEQIVESLYAPYLSDSKDIGALDAILPYASKSLHALIKKENECSIGVICAIDFDVIVGGQDWNPSDLSNLVIKQELKNEQLIVTANLFFIESPVHLPHQHNYFFINEDGKWKIDDVENINYKDDGTVLYRFSLKNTIKRFFESYPYP